VSDGAEHRIGSSLTSIDSDNDGITDYAEYTSGTLTAVEVQPVPTSPGTPTPSGSVAAPSTAGQGPVESFVDAALSQRGDDYIFGHEVSLSDSNPTAFDCSELTQWAADQAGVTIPDGAMYQYLDLKQSGTLMPVSEALKTRGALLFYFSSEPTPGGSRPTEAHVAISLGDGKTIEARGTSYGVNEFAAENRFNYAGMIPEFESSSASAGQSSPWDDPLSGNDPSGHDDGGGLGHYASQLEHDGLGGGHDGGGHDPLGGGDPHF
jgi:cell wall-associated NlpC family hydrolase